MWGAVFRWQDVLCAVSHQVRGGGEGEALCVRVRILNELISGGITVFDLPGKTFPD